VTLSTRVCYPFFIDIGGCGAREAFDALNQHSLFVSSGTGLNGQLGVGPHRRQPAVDGRDRVTFSQQPLHEAFNSAPGHAALGLRNVLEVGAVAFFQLPDI
jgi:hypothetical protein